MSGKALKGLLGATGRRTNFHSAHHKIFMIHTNSSVQLKSTPKPAPAEAVPAAPAPAAQAHAPATPEAATFKSHSTSRMSDAKVNEQMIDLYEQMRKAAPNTYQSSAPVSSPKDRSDIVGAFLKALEMITVSNKKS